MKQTEWTEEYDRLLARSSPLVLEPSDAELARAWARVESGLAANRPHRGRRWWTTAGICIGAVVLGTTGVAAADFFTARTGQGPSSEEDLVLGGPGERLDPAASDYADVLAQETTDIPFPNASQREIAIADQVDDAKDPLPGSGSVATGAVRAWLASAAVCAWSNQWAGATRDGDGAARAEAVTMIGAAASWPAVLDIDPSPYSRPESVEGLEADGDVTQWAVRNESQFYYLRPLRDALDGKSMGAVSALLRENNAYCSPGLVPDLPGASRVSPGH